MIGTVKDDANLDTRRALYALLAGTRVLRIDPAVRKGFDGSGVEVVDGALGVVPPSPVPADDGS